MDRPPPETSPFPPPAPLPFSHRNSRPIVFHRHQTVAIFPRNSHRHMPASRCRVQRVYNQVGKRVGRGTARRSEEHTSELQSHLNLVCRLLLEKKKKIKN